MTTPEQSPGHKFEINGGNSELSAESIPRMAYQRLTIMAHQGWQGDNYPSNSLRAISAALGVADAVEFDVYAIPHADDPSKTSVIAHHPETYFLWVDPKGMSNTGQLPLTFEQAREVKVNGERVIPTIDEILDAHAVKAALTGKRTELQIELKGPGSTEALVPILQKRIAEGELSYDDFALTGLCTPGDRSKLENAHALDPRMKLVVVVRGGDLKVDGFADYDEVFSFARSINAENITVTRRELTSALVAKIHDAGFKVGSFHCRTSDELSAALSLGADYIAADFFKGPSVSSYSGVKLAGSPLFDDLNSSGFYRLRDWIWELGWDCEKFRTDESIPSQIATTAPLAKADGVLSFSETGPLTLRLCANGALSDKVLNISDVKIPDKYLGAFDTMLHPDGITFREFLAETEQAASFRDIALELLAQRSWAQSTELYALLEGITFEDIARISNGHIEKVLKPNGPELSHHQISFLEELSNEFLTRTGRIIGVLAFATLVPRHGPKPEYAVRVESQLCEQSEIVRKAVVEQVKAQLLRSGKSGTASFS